MPAIPDPSIASFGEAVPGDLFSVSGTGFAAGMNLTFFRDDEVVCVSPEFVRPHLAVLTSLPGNLVAGEWELAAEVGAETAEGVLVEVSGAAAPTVRLLQAGEPDEAPYTIAFVANPVVRDDSGAFSADPVMSDRRAFRNTVTGCLENLFLVAEDILTAGGRDARIRLVTVFDAGAGVLEENCLAAEVYPDYTETLRGNAAPFLLERGIEADVVFVIFKSSTHAYASAWYTTGRSSPPPRAGGRTPTRPAGRPTTLGRSTRRGPT